MAYYTERHGLRRPIEKTSKISLDKYALLLHCCEQYYIHISWKYPEECPDGNGCCGLNHELLTADMKYEIPSLFIDDYGKISCPREHRNVFENSSTFDTYDQYALLDYIEFIGFNCKDVLAKNWHSYYNHHDIRFSGKNSSAERFRNDINAIFEKTGLLYYYNEDGYIERVVEHSVITEQTLKESETITEPGVKELLETAIVLHKSTHPSDHKDAVEKIWDALERLKTYYTAMDKKASVTKIVENMANGESHFVSLFDTEFKALTSIGNDFRIRHHETNKIDITDARHYDYFFNRCLSLISLSIHYLQ